MEQVKVQAASLLEGNRASERETTSLSLIWEMCLPNFEEVIGDFNCINKEAWSLIRIRIFGCKNTSYFRAPDLWKTLM